MKWFVWKYKIRLSIFIKKNNVFQVLKKFDFHCLFFVHSFLRSFLRYHCLVALKFATNIVFHFFFFVTMVVHPSASTGLNRGCRGAAGISSSMSIPFNSSSTFCRSESKLMSSTTSPSFLSTRHLERSHLGKLRTLSMISASLFVEQILNKSHSKVPTSSVDPSSTIKLSSLLRIVSRNSAIS